jgi:hypothetical protein
MAWIFKLGIGLYIHKTVNKMENLDEKIKV